MTAVSDLKLRLLNRLRAAGKSAAATGIDLGTTKSCFAYARYDARANTLDCRCVEFARPDGGRSAAFPSAIAQLGELRTFGAPALALRKSRGMRAERDLFYETKNLIGLRYTFKDAPPDLRNATDVAAALVAHMRTEAHARMGDAIPVAAPVVVAVPASFHAAQREATVHAAERAHAFEHDRGKVRLVDEPYAAFVDLKFREPERADALLREGANVLVFDFGGGTCDVAIFRIDSARGGTLGARLIGTSRYHRLGGGDIDRAIVHDVLIPQLLAQHKVDGFTVSWQTRRYELERQLLDTAERLKIALNGKLVEHHAAGIAAPPELTCSTIDLVVECDGKRLDFARPTLDIAAFDKLLVSFLDPEPVPEAGDEYVQRNSMFAPILQALARAKLECEDIHGVLACGSSSLLAPAQKALQKFLPKAELVLLGTADDLQQAVARGAALQALSLQVLGEPVVAPVCSAEISLKLAQGEALLCRAGDSVPNRSQTPVLLRPPRASQRDGIEIAVEILSDGKRSAGRSLWSLSAPVRADEPLELAWTLDENQCVELRLSRPADTRTETFVKRFDAPIMHRDLSQLVRCRLLEREERLRNDQIARADLGDAYERHARDCASLGEFDKALHFLSLALQEQGETRVLLNLRGIWRERVGNKDGARDSYERAGEWSTTRFNLALLHYRAGNYAEAMPNVESALDLDNERAYRVLRGDIHDKLGQRDEARAQWQDALDGPLDLAAMDDFQLGWLETAARRLDNAALLKRIQEHRRKIAVSVTVVSQQGELPARYGDDAILDDEESEAA
jgi:tetratricopeptide (TPR) repeat protein